MGGEWSLMARDSSVKAEWKKVLTDFICLKPLSHTEDEPRITKR
jgi:hypothetical protein